MRNKCIYCCNFVYDPDPSSNKRVCEKCEEQVKKLDENTVNWLMMVIDGRIEKEFDSHTDRYSHESSHPGYY